jgi:hypothetical protein
VLLSIGPLLICRQRSREANPSKPSPERVSAPSITENSPNLTAAGLLTLRLIDVIGKNVSSRPKKTPFYCSSDMNVDLWRIVKI